MRTTTAITWEPPEFALANSQEGSSLMRTTTANPCSYDHLGTSEFALGRETAHLCMDCIVKTSVPESRHERASNVQSGLALPAISCPISSSIRFTILSRAAGRGKRVLNT